MALKRINKELTDLGRYVISFPSTARLACSLLLAWAATWQRPGARPYARTRRCCFARRPRVEYLADTLPLVTLPLPVRLALLEMIWYVTLCARLPRLRHSHRHDRGKKRQGQTHANCAAVSLASNHHGSRTSILDARYSQRPHLSWALVYCRHPTDKRRATHHTPAAFSS